MKRIILAIIVVALILGALAWFGLSRRSPHVSAQLIAAAEDISGYTRADDTRPLDLPADFGPHPDYLTEWWYYTGNLDSVDGRHFGYQLTFFRRAVSPPHLRQSRESDWAADQLYLSHFSLTDVAGDEYRAFERFTRGAAGLAGAQAEPYRVWLEDWQIEQRSPDVVALHALQDDIVLDLTLTDVKGIILQGQAGYSLKGAEPGNASYYFSQTRLQSEGSLTIRGETFAVGGLSWMDHEFSTSALAPDQVGWDWFSIQLDDGSELMLFQLRKEDGSTDPFSSGTFIAVDGQTTHLAYEDFEIAVGDTWRSPRSGAEYPSQWELRVPSLDLILALEPHLSDQELNVFFVYWEGAVRIMGTRAGNAVVGNGYVEMTGYAASMQGQF